MTSLRSKPICRVVLYAALCAVVAFGPASVRAQSARRDMIEQYEVQMRTFNFEQALQTAQDALTAASAAKPQRAPDVVQANTMVGRAYLALENTAAAETSFTEALKLA